jgi:TetR/AcrR family transcriptional repressor of nem operon
LKSAVSPLDIVRYQCKRFDSECDLLRGSAMRYSADHVEATRVRVLAAAARAFREHGFSGLGVEGLAKAAGLTTGAFYNHFGSKAGAFAAVVSTGIERVKSGVDHVRNKYGGQWLAVFAAHYLGSNHRSDVGGGCIMPSLSSDVARSDEATKAAYQATMLEIAAAIADGMPDAADRTEAWPILAQLVGGVALSRAMRDPGVADEIANSVLASIASRPGQV